MQQQRPVPADLHGVLPAADRVDAARPAPGSHVGTLGAQPDGRPEGRAVVCVVVPVRTISSSNAREHWAVRARRVKTERAAALLVLRSTGCPLWTAPLVVRLTRISGPRGKTLDDDNLRGCLKAIRDGVADWLGVQDNDPRITWRYDQRKADAWGVEIEVTA